MKITIEVPDDSPICNHAIPYGTDECRKCGIKESLIQFVKKEIEVEN